MQARSPVGRAESGLDAVCQPCDTVRGCGLQGGSGLAVAGADPPPDPQSRRRRPGFRVSTSIIVVIPQGIPPGLTGPSRRRSSWPRGGPPRSAAARRRS